MVSKLSNLAAKDFAAIYEYTLLNFGSAQADEYTTDLERVFSLLSSSPSMGYECSEIKSGLRRHDHQKHALFYYQTHQELFIVRILHHKIGSMSDILANEQGKINNEHND